MHLFNTNSLELCAHLESLARAEEKFTATTSKTKTQPKKSIWAGLADFFTKGVKTGTTVARAVGLPRPMAREIETLSQMKTALRRLSHTSSEIRHRAVPRLYARKKPEADLLAARLTQAAKQAEAQGESVNRAIDAAINAALASQRDLEAGKPRATALASYMLRRQQADTQFNAARLRLDGIHSSWQAAERQLVAMEPTAVRETGRIIKETVSQFTQTAARAAKDVGGGLLSVTPALKYLPHIAVGVGAIYLLSALPRRQQS